MNTTPEPSTPPTASEARAARRKTLRLFLWVFVTVLLINFALFRALIPAAGPGGLTVAAFRADFQPETPKAGWRYLWNANGPVGHATNYAELAWNGSFYAADATLPFPNPPPARFLRITAQGGHPGQGPAQRGVGDEVFAIASWRVVAGGRHWLTNSFLARHSARSGSVHLQVFVNDVEIGEAVYCGGTDGVSFDRSLGKLSVGDVIYVAVGPNETDLEDGFDLDFTVLR